MKEKGEDKEEKGKRRGDRRNKKGEKKEEKKFQAGFNLNPGPHGRIIAAMHGPPKANGCMYYNNIASHSQFCCAHLASY